MKIKSQKGKFMQFFERLLYHDCKKCDFKCLAFLWLSFEIANPSPVFSSTSTK